MILRSLSLPAFSSQPAPFNPVNLVNPVKFLFLAFPLILSLSVSAKPALSKSTLTLELGGIDLLLSEPASGLRLESSNPQTVQVLPGGFIVGLSLGQARILAKDADSVAECVVTVQPAAEVILDPARLKQYPDDRAFNVNGRKCYGSELNGQRASSPEERRFTRSNRVINPKPLRQDQPVEWEVQDGTEIYDGAGVLMGTVAPRLAVGSRRVPVSKFNFGMSKVLHGKLCLYAFAVTIKASPSVAKLLDPSESPDAIGTSAWLPLDRVVDKATLLQRIGLGKIKLPTLPLESKPYRVTGGNPKLYLTDSGEMSIVRAINSGPVPSHYLRRPSGTVNLLYSVPGFGLGGQGLDSFLVSDSLQFYPAKGAKVFVQPTYFPAKHAQAGHVSPKTMTFLYGAIKGPNIDPVYGWLSKESLQ
jgi:hypothetical protein